MTDKEQIKELADFIFDYTEPAVLGASDVAEIIYDAGYHKIIWHRVAEGDLPKETSLYLCKMIYNEFYRSGYKVLLFNTTCGFYDNGLSITKDEVIAWTELPTYKE